MSHEEHMRSALCLAQQALDADEFPVGCIVVHKGKAIASGTRINTRQTVPSELNHAEMIALRQLEGRSEPDERRDMTLYATLEPCLMCFGAILLSGIGTLVYAYEDAMGGGAGCDRSQWPELYRANPITIVPGVCRKESLILFQSYFRRPHIRYWQGSRLARYTLAQSQ